jgi:hypothetical protein
MFCFLSPSLTAPFHPMAVEVMRLCVHPVWDPARSIYFGWWWWWSVTIKHQNLGASHCKETHT